MTSSVVGEKNVPADGCKYGLVSVRVMVKVMSLGWWLLVMVGVVGMMALVIVRVV